MNFDIELSTKMKIPVFLLNPLKTLYFQGVSPVLRSSLMYFPLFLPLRAETRETLYPNAKLLFRQVISSRHLRAKYTSCTKLPFVQEVFHSYTWRTARKGERPKQAQTVAGARQTTETTQEIL